MKMSLVKTGKILATDMYEGFSYTIAARYYPKPDIELTAVFMLLSLALLSHAKKVPFRLYQHFGYWGFLYLGLFTLTERPALWVNANKPLFFNRAVDLIKEPYPKHYDLYEKPQFSQLLLTAGAFCVKERRQLS